MTEKYSISNPQRKPRSKAETIIIKLIEKKHDIKTHYELYLKSFLQFIGLDNQRINVCEIGGFDGWALSYDNGLINKTVIDVEDDYEDELNNKGIGFVHHDFNTILNTKVEYDVVLMNHVIEHLKDYEVMMLNLHKMIKAGGFIIIRCPNILNQKLKFYHDYTHVKPYTPTSVERMFNSFGFKKVYIGGFNYTKFVVRWLFGNYSPVMSGTEILYVGQKKEALL